MKEVIKLNHKEIMQSIADYISKQEQRTVSCSIRLIAINNEFSAEVEIL